MLGLARRVLPRNGDAAPGKTPQPSLVSDGLRAALTRFAGADGYASLLCRALALAAADIPALKGVKVGADARLEGLESLGGGKARHEAAVAITAHLLDLLVTFIGERLTLRLVREVWPDTALQGSHLESEAER